uniref:VPS9 domain containing 1 n=1 Tax=Serinus canaria TaxID=9135 RepID=A0A8C9UC31_SERCA
MLKLAEQCLERVKSIAAVLGKAQVKVAAQERGGGPAPLPRHRRVCSDEGGKLSPFLPPEIFQKLQIAEAQSARKYGGLGPGSWDTGAGTWEAQTQRTLSLQRQMMENLVIAKAREETLQRKMEERRLRLQEAANRRFSSSVALTPEEQEQRALYAAILEYEQDHDWPRQWKVQLKRSPADLSVVSGLFSCLLSCPEHPISQLLRRLQCAVYTRLYPAISRGPADASPASPSPGGRRLRASRSLHCMFSVPEHGPAALRHSQSSTPLADSSAPGPAEPPEPARESSFEDLERFLASPEGWAPADPPASSGQDTALPELLKGIVRDIHNAIDRLLALTLLAFEGLGTAAGKDHLTPALCCSAGPARHLRVCRGVLRHPGRPEPRHGRHVSAGATESTGREGRCGACGQPGIGAPVPVATMADGPCCHSGADDLLPILSYVVLQTGLPQLLSECAALEEFIHEGYLIGEEGYCLTSLQSALSYVESLPRGGEVIL